jgi:hypothetical protein
MKNVPVNIYCELICFIVSLIAVYKKKSLFLLLFFVYITTTTILETITYYQSTHNQSARILNNILNILGLFFYSYIMLKHYFNKPEKRIIYLLSIAYSTYWLYEMFVERMIDKFVAPVWMLSWLIQILICLLYFKLYLQKDIYESVSYYNAGFYIAMGVFIFCFGSIIVIAFADKIRIHNLNILGIPLHQFIIRLLCIPLYGFISIALIKWNPSQTTNSTLS